MEQYHLTSLYSMLAGCGGRLAVAVVRFPDESECQLGEAALRISGIELMKAVLRVWRVEEGPVRRVLRVLLRRVIGCTAAEKEH